MDRNDGQAAATALDTHVEYTCRAGHEFETYATTQQIRCKLNAGETTASWTMLGTCGEHGAAGRDA
jgi:hypothetical protein